MISDHAGSDLRRELSSVSGEYPSFEQALEAAYRSSRPVLAVSESGNSFQIAANKYYRDFPAASVASFLDIDEALQFFVRLFEIRANTDLLEAKELMSYIEEKT